jgi:hypothetical protein
MKTLHPILVVLGLLAVLPFAVAGDSGTTRGIIDISKQERPADAVTLIGPDGYNLVPEGKEPTKWFFADGVLTASPAWDSVLTKDTYQDLRMHAEFNVNEVKDAKDPEADGNSGIYIQLRYEIQILNSFGVPPADYKPSYCGSIYRQKNPDRCVCKKAGEWQSYDIVFRAARFDGGNKTENARITVYQNGELIHDDYAITNKTGVGEKEGPEPRPVKLQGHHNPVRFRNVWIQKLSLGADEAKPAAKGANIPAADKPAARQGVSPALKAMQQDLVAQFIKSFKSRGLKVGLYYCWRDPGFKKEFKVLPPECDPATHSLLEQNEFQKKQIAELIEKHPDVFYIWNDGLDTTIMPAEEALAFIRGLGPGILASSNWWDWAKKGTPYADIAVNEMRHFPETNTFPGETCWCLEKSWFWSEGTRPKTAKQVVDLLTIANARNSNFLLNVGPNKQGRFEPESVKVLAEIGKLRQTAVPVAPPK